MDKQDKQSQLSNVPQSSSLPAPKKKKRKRGPDHRGRTGRPKGRRPNQCLKFTPAARAAAVRMFEKTNNRQAAADAAGVKYCTITRRLRDDPSFRDEMNAAHERYVLSLESAAYDRAVNGVIRQKTGPNGSLITETHHSDKLLIHLLEISDRRRHGKVVKVDSTTRLVGAIGLASLSPESRDQLREIIERETAIAAATVAVDTAALPAAIEDEDEDEDDGDD